MMVESFDRIGLGQWFRIVTGLVEIVGAVALLVPGKEGKSKNDLKDPGGHVAATRWRGGGSDEHLRHG
jgi:hypothetical protein